MQRLSHLRRRTRRSPDPARGRGLGSGRGLWAPARPRRRAGLASSRRAHSRIRAGQSGARGRSVGGLRRLQNRARPDLHPLRAGGLPHLRDGVDLRPADLPLAPRRNGLQRHSRLVAVESGRGEGHAAARLRARKGAASARGTRRVGGTDPHARIGGAHDGGLPRGRRGAAADSPRELGRRPGRPTRRARDRAPVGRCIAVGPAARRLLGGLRFRLDGGPRRAAQTVDQPRLYRLRSRGLAQPPWRHPRDRRRARLGDPRIHGAGGSLAARAGTRRLRGGDAVRGRARRPAVEES